MEGEEIDGGGKEVMQGKGVMEGQMERKRMVVLASHFVRGQSFSLGGGRPRWQAVVFVRGRRGSCPGRSSFVRRGRCLPRCRSWSWLLFLGLGCRLWTPRRRL